MGLNLCASYTSLMISIVQMRTLRFLSALQLDSAIPSLPSEVLTKVSDNKEPKTRTPALQSNLVHTDLFIHSLIRLLLWVLFILCLCVQPHACTYVSRCPSLGTIHFVFEWVSLWFAIWPNSLGQLARKPRSSFLHLRSHYNWDYNSVPPGPDFNIGSGDPNFCPHTLLTLSSPTPPPFVFARQDLAM